MSNVEMFKAGFTFRSVKATEAKFAEVLAGFDAAQVPYDVETQPAVGEDGQALVGDAGQPVLAYKSILRKSFEAELPLVTMEELAQVDPAFVLELAKSLVETTARKMYVDKLLPIGVVTVADVIRENTPAERESQVSPELLAEFSGIVGKVLASKNASPAQVATYLELIKGKFATKVITKHINSAKVLPNVLAGFETLAAGLEGGAKFKPMLEAFGRNYANWLSAQEAKKEELDFSLLG